jgi:hypothetical protein
LANLGVTNWQSYARFLEAQKNQLEAGLGYHRRGWALDLCRWCRSRCCRRRQAEVEVEVEECLMRSQTGDRSPARSALARAVATASRVPRGSKAVPTLRVQRVCPLAGVHEGRSSLQRDSTRDAVPLAGSPEGQSHFGRGSWGTRSSHVPAPP